MTINHFKNICKMSQAQVKLYMKSVLEDKQYKVIDEDGFLYAKGDIPVLLVAHMDTVHKTLPLETMEVNGKISSPQGIGGDDRCGIFIISEIIRELHCSVLLCEDEEIGGVGAGKFAKTKYIDDLGVNYMIEFDRTGSDDAVFYSCDNPDFTDFVTKNTGYKETLGTYSDISTIMPASKLCGVNLSSGYYNAHTVKEYVVYEDMLYTIETAKDLIEAECDGPFEYIAKTYKYGGYWDDYGYGYGGSYCTTTKSVANRATKDTTLELEVTVNDYEFGSEDLLYATGNTKAECWLNFFTKHPKICFNDIIDYIFY